MHYGYIFLHPKTERLYTAKPKLLYDYIAANQKYQTIIIDEVQKVPAVLSVAHDIIEQRKDLQFVLTGSSARKINRTGTNLLTVRALTYCMHPFMASELENLFNLEQALQYGLIPIIDTAANTATIIQVHINLYLKEEIQMEGLTRNIDDFAGFLEAINFSYATLINVSNNYVNLINIRHSLIQPIINLVFLLNKSELILYKKSSPINI